MSGFDHLLDTNVVIGLLKGHGPAVSLVEKTVLVDGRIAISQVTRMELLGFPGLTSDEEQAVRRLLAHFVVLPVDAAVEERAISLRRAGQLRLPDAIVAATALASGATLLTLDERMARVFAQEATTDNAT